MLVTRSKGARVLALFVLVVLGASPVASAQYFSDRLAINPQDPTFLWQYLGLRGVVKEMRYFGDNPSTVTFEPSGTRQTWTTTRGPSPRQWDPERRTVTHHSEYGTSVVSFDESGREVAYRFISSTRYEYFVNALGQTEKISDKHRSVFDANGFLILRQDDDTVTVYERDGFGNPVLLSSRSSDGTEAPTHRYEYVYDNQGNWVEFRQFQWVPVLGRFSADPKVVRREITYF